MSSYPLLNTQNGRKWDISANNVDLISLNGNGTSGQVLSSNGPTLAPSWSVLNQPPTSTIAVTDTSTAGTYYPTFVSAAGSNQTLRADIASTPLSYNPSTGVLTSTSVVASGGNFTNTISSTSMAIVNTSTADTFTLTQSTLTTLTAPASYTITSGDSSLNLQVARSSGSSTLTLGAQQGGSGGGSATLELSSGSGSGNQSVNLQCSDFFSNDSALTMQKTNIQLKTAINGGESTAGYTGIKLTTSADLNYITNNDPGNPLFISRVDASGWMWGYTVSGGATTKIMTLDTSGVLGFPNASQGIIEKSTINGTTTGTTILDASSAFQTIINTPSASGRKFILPAPTLATVGYWYGFCNKSTSQTITVDASFNTFVYTVPVSFTSGSNTGIVVKLAVDASGTSYFACATPP
jgi:hypothetical protein